MEAIQKVDPVDADAEIAAIMAKAERYEQAAQEQYGHLRMYARLYKYVDATNAALADLLREYIMLCHGDMLHLAQDYTKDPSTTAAFIKEWSEQRDELRERAEELLSE